MRGGLIVLFLCACHPSSIPAQTPLPPAPAASPKPAEAVAPDPAPPPEPEGDSLVVERFPCVYEGCPASRVEVFENGHVRWLGIEFVSAAGVRTAAIDPADSQALLDRWDALPLDDAPKTSEEAMLHPHLAVRCVVRTSDAQSIRRCAVLGIAEGRPESPAAAVDAFASDIEGVAEVAEFMRKDCYGLQVESPSGFDQRARVGYGGAASNLARGYFRDPDNSVIRIVVAQRATANPEALAFRAELLELGVPLPAVRYERIVLPSGAFEEPGWGYLILGSPLYRDWGWAAVLTLSCLEASRS